MLALCYDEIYLEIFMRHLITITSNNKTKQATLFILKIIFMLVLSSCDPGLNGDLKVFNQSDSTLTVFTLDYGSHDSVTSLIQPNSTGTIKVLGGLGNQKTFDCCPCEFQAIYIKTKAGNIKKDPGNKNNWVIPNKAEQKKFGGKNLKCEFYVTQTDI